MSNIIAESIAGFSGQLTHICKSFTTPPEGAYQVNFNRLELVLSGHCHVILDTPQGHHTQLFSENEILYIPPNAWCKPIWSTSCRFISILFGKKQVGFSYIQYEQDEGFTIVEKHAIPLPCSLMLEHILEALNNFCDAEQIQTVGNCLSQALLSYCENLFISPQSEQISRSEKLYRNICIYIQENFHQDLTRAKVANKFGISTSHISRIFHQEGAIKFAEYVTYVRLDRAKFMLTKYNFKVEEISHRCGFNDINYFCRVFKQKTGKTPSEYRLHSQ